MALFDYGDPTVIHGKALQSRELACYNESKTFPFTSLKHHVLLATVLVENFRELKDRIEATEILREIDELLQESDINVE